MQPLRMVAPVASLCLLTACAGSIGADLAPVPGGLTEPCATPGALGTRPLSQAEVEIAWGRDRSALRDCGERHALVLAFIEGQRTAGRR